MQRLMASAYRVSVGSARGRRMLSEPKEGDFWEADHIVPVAEGGGETSLDNFQTLCTPCHAKKTKAQADAKKHAARAAAAAGTADMRGFLAPPAR